MSASFGYTDSFASTLTMENIPSLDYDKDFAITKQGESDVILTNVTTPVDQPETLRYAISDVQNVYKNTQIQPLHREDGLRGKSVLISLLDTARVVQGSDTVDYPIKVGITVQYPLSANLTVGDIGKVAKRAIAATQDYMKTVAIGKTDLDAGLFNELVRGQLNPKDGVKCSTRS